jgi:hypothetical protein
MAVEHNQCWMHADSILAKIRAGEWQTIFLRVINRRPVGCCSADKEAARAGLRNEYISKLQHCRDLGLECFFLFYCPRESARTLVHLTAFALFRR